MIRQFSTDQARLGESVIRTNPGSWTDYDNATDVDGTHVRSVIVIWALFTLEFFACVVCCIQFVPFMGCKTTKADKRVASNLCSVVSKLSNYDRC